MSSQNHEDEVLVQDVDTGEVLELPGLAEAMTAYRDAAEREQRLRDDYAGLLAAFHRATNAGRWLEEAGEAAKAAAEAKATIAGLLADDRRAEGNLPRQWRARAAGVEVVWPRPSKEWRTELPLPTIAARYPDIAATLGLREVTGKPKAPTVKLVTP